MNPRPEAGAQSTPRIALIGQPNTGKSMLFNRITNARASVGNWPGITVNVMRARVPLAGRNVEYVDLPGIYNLEGGSEDEAVVNRFLTKFPIDLVIIVINAAQIERQILMPLQVKALGLPAVVMLNMCDEARKLGITFDLEQLQNSLKMPVALISAKYGTGFDDAMKQVSDSLSSDFASKPVLADYDSLFKTLMTEETLDDALKGCVTLPKIWPKTLTEKLDQLFLHPLLGLPMFFLSMLVIFSVIWEIGLPSQDLVSRGADWVQTILLEPGLAWAPVWLNSFLINGIWLGLSTVASFVPLLVLFFFCMAAVEDSGYLARAAFLMDALMRRVGLDGRAFVMQMMGFGCNVPALMGTRVMRTRSLRLLAMLVIPFSLCSARLAVFVFIISATFPSSEGALVLFSFYVISFLAAFSTAAIFSFSKQFKSQEPFLLEIPPYRIPTVKQVLLRGWGEVREFIRRASRFIIIGCILVWLLTNLPVGAEGLNTYGGQLGVLLQPIMEPIGINPYLTLALIFGFIAKEIVIGSLSTIYALSASGVSQAISMSVTPLEAYSFCLFCLLYTPCLTTIATVHSEGKSWQFTSFSLILSLSYAWLVSFLFYQGAKLFGF
ncbi:MULTISPECIES: ferrous iron transport protein B [unclassified Pseudovibrio]|uniref:ferrous iron transport protein B n=1 Tax=unclassified Pseudovibrio TaxID=2627060 RepID=UPI0007AE7D93|nr:MULTISPECIES: ferrous iron transport protein B [unclassified Pseudovibrio]KZK94513.1 Ferrous iron transport protein B [Pseudovibrio sp. W74]KZL06913.1 Ferrous iron transport protein B [Pseudovibrio sp. Ad14]